MPRVRSPSTGRYLGSTAAGYAGKAASPVYVTYKAQEMIRLADRLRGEALKIDRASRVAHTRLAQALQGDIAEVLTVAVGAHGRAQKTEKPAAARLANAIRDERNRRVNATGFTVGYLDEIEAVRPYYRGLEVGTAVHVGRFLHGVFSTGGASSPPRPGGKDARFYQRSRYSNEHPFSPGVRISHSIIGYRYFEGGQRKFTARGGTGSLAAAAYRDAFNARGMDLLARAMNAGSRTTPRQVGSAGFGQGEYPLGT